MALHRLSSYTYQVPNVEETSAYYEEFGLSNNGDGSFSTVEGGRQLLIEHGPYRRITRIELGADDEDDIGRIHASLAGLGFAAEIEGESKRLVAIEPATRMRVEVAVQDRVVQQPFTPSATNYPGVTNRENARADGVMREDKVRPRRLGHILLVTGDLETSMRFFREGVGFKVSDFVTDGAFMRCSTDHHNLALFGGPASFPHHTSWQVNDIDDIGRAANDLLDADYNRQMWGFGRHYAGSNFFWYLKDPAGTYSEYYADMDQITDDDLWKPEMCEGPRGLYRWGPPVPPDFVAPKDVADLIAAQAQ